MSRKNEAITLWRNKDLPPIVAALRELAPELARKPMQRFSIIVETIITTAFEKFMRRYNVTSGDAFTTEIMAAFLKYTVSSINKTLPLYYPYIVLIFFDKPTNRFHFGVMRRKLISEMHDLLKSNTVPIIEYEGRKTVQPGNYHISFTKNKDRRARRATAKRHS